MGTTFITQPHSHTCTPTTHHTPHTVTQWACELHVMVWLNLSSDVLHNTN
eukprot:m.257427 g.257427  ORF g.257427 m.257427 type:complete len:50 (+) comp35294_c0_seq1:61-210(+)